MSDLVAYWSFDDAKNPLLDVSGNGNHLAFSSADAYSPWSKTTATGTGFSYSPTNDRISLSSTFTEPLSMPSYTVSFWLNPNDLNGHWNCMGANGDWGSFWMHTFAGGNEFYVGQTASVRVNAGAVFPAGTWTNFTYAYKNGVATLYKDGEFLTSYNGGETTNYPAWSTYHLGIGGAYNVSGNLDNVSIWKTALSANEVKLLGTNRVTASQLSTMSADAKQLLTDNPTMNAPTANAIANNEIAFDSALDNHADAYAREVLQDNPIAYWRMEIGKNS